MDTDAPAPELFVARDRARRFARYIREALQERRLFYRGAEVGMTSESTAWSSFSTQKPTSFGSG